MRSNVKSDKKEITLGCLSKNGYTNPFGYTAEIDDIRTSHISQKSEDIKQV